MYRYALRRFLAVFPTIIFASIIVFLALRMIPGSVVDVMLSENTISNTENKNQLVAALGFDKPMYVQYFRWAGAIVLHHDLGKSLWSNQSVSSLIADRLPTTLYLGALAIFFALLIALPIGVLSAVRQDALADYIGRSVAILALAVPAFWLGTMVVVFPSVWWNVAPTTEYVPFSVDPWLSLKQMSIPALVLGVPMSGMTMRMTRTMVLEVMRQDYVRTAWAKGLNETTVIWRHVMKNALLPVVTVIGLHVPVVLGGAVIIEQIFVISGMGQLLLDSVSQRDYPLITGIFLVVGVGITLINLLVDLSYGLLDPKIRQG
jgi:peptide/nickel transport system permease protein